MGLTVFKIWKLGERRSDCSGGMKETTGKFRKRDERLEKDWYARGNGRRASGVGRETPGGGRGQMEKQGPAILVSLSG